MGGALTRMLGRGSPTTGGAHRYWRLRFPSGSPDPNFVAVAEIEMRATVSGVDLTTAVCSASSNDTGFGPSKAFDNTIGGSNPGWFSHSGNSVNAWIANDLGTASDLAEIVIWAYQTAGYGPTEIVVEYSDDNASWTQDTRWPPIAGWSWDASEIRAIRRSATPAIYSAAGNMAGLTQNNGGWTNFTLRQLLPSSMVPGRGETRLRIALQAGSVEGLTINSAHVGKRGSGSLDFASTPTQVTFNGGSAGFAIGTSVVQYSDEIALSFTSSDDLVLSMYCPSGASATDTFRRSTGGGTSGFKAGNDATTLTASGYTGQTNTYLAALESWTP